MEGSARRFWKRCWLITLEPERRWCSDPRACNAALICPLPELFHESIEIWPLPASFERWPAAWLRLGPWLLTIELDGKGARLTMNIRNERAKRARQAA